MAAHTRSQRAGARRETMAGAYAAIERIDPEGPDEAGFQALTTQESRRQKFRCRLQPILSADVYLRPTDGKLFVKVERPGLVVQLVRIHACHAWGREFESRPARQPKSRVPQLQRLGDFCFPLMPRVVDQGASIKPNWTIMSDSGIHPQSRLGAKTPLSKTSSESTNSACSDRRARLFSCQGSWSRSYSSNSGAASTAYVFQGSTPASDSESMACIVAIWRRSLLILRGRRISC